MSILNVEVKYMRYEHFTPISKDEKVLGVFSSMAGVMHSIGQIRS